MSLGPICRRKRPFILYHWSPVERRRQIERQGLKVGSRCAVHSPGWKPTYLCFSDSPSLAWALSGQTMPKSGRWDLWMCWSSSVPSGALRRRSDYPASKPAEYRSTESVPKNRLWLVATRSRKQKTKRNGSD